MFVTNVDCWCQYFCIAECAIYRFTLSFLVHNWTLLRSLRTMLFRFLSSRSLSLSLPSNHAFTSGARFSFYDDMLETFVIEWFCLTYICQACRFVAYVAIIRHFFPTFHDVGSIDQTSNRKTNKKVTAIHKTAIISQAEKLTRILRFHQ